MQVAHVERISEAPSNGSLRPFLMGMPALYVPGFVISTTESAFCWELEYGEVDFGRIIQHTANTKRRINGRKSELNIVSTNALNISEHPIHASYCLVCVFHREREKRSSLVPTLFFVLQETRLTISSGDKTPNCTFFTRRTSANEKEN